ncbi:MAG: class I SAM-dependent methyltransferase [Alphaproteobacteria bacterium]|nr:class I SAM-dependent methyltransferase [Alphaproteobacteria bacterium]
MNNQDLRQFAPACARNSEPILAVLNDHLPKDQKINVLEIAAGTGEHAVFFASNFPHAKWQPTEFNQEAHKSIQAWIDHSQVSNILPPIGLDVCQHPWPINKVDVVLAINMIHISDWSCTEGLMKGAGKHLSSDGLLYLYGPYKREGKHTAESNVDFNSWLKERNPKWGIRDMEEVISEAAKHGLEHQKTEEMPANNFSMVFKKLS